MLEIPIPSPLCVIFFASPDEMSLLLLPAFREAAITTASRQIISPDPVQIRP